VSRRYLLVADGDVFSEHDDVGEARSVAVQLDGVESFEVRDSMDNERVVARWAAKELAS
jgi:hypothetical protein